MRLPFLELLRCPYCGGRVALAETVFTRRSGDALEDGILGCHCCAFPVVSGIPVFHLEPAAEAARRHLERGEHDQALIAMFGIDDAERASAFERVRTAPAATYREIVEALGPGFERGYFLYRFSDPTYVVAQSVVRAIATAVLAGGGRAIDIAGGSGHLTRTLGEFATEPVLIDLHFSKLWLAARFVAPGCQPVCCDAHAPLPFCAGAFRLAVCSDAFHYIWTKRLLASEMMRLVGDDGVAALTHVHNERQWNPSAGMPLPPDGYADLFADLGARVYSERRLLAEIAARRLVDLDARHDPAELDGDPALTVVATRRPDVLVRRAAARPRPRPLRINPLYETEPAAAGIRCRLRYPSAEYADEYGEGCRLYLPEEVTIPSAVAAAAAAGVLPAGATDLVDRRVLLDLPDGYL